MFSRLSVPWAERLLHWADLASFTGLISGTALAFAFGKLLLAVVLCAFAVGAYLRIRRGRASAARREL